MKEKNIKEKTQQKKKMGLTTKIFVALIAGAILGIILCYLVPDSSFKKDVIVEGILYVIGQGFIRLMKMLVVPLVFCSLVCGSMSIGDTKKLGTVGVRTLVFYLATTALAVSVALTVGNQSGCGTRYELYSVLRFLGGDYGGYLSYRYYPEYHPGQSDQFPGKRNHASGYRICPDRGCDPCENGRACRDSGKLFQPVQ